MAAESSNKRKEPMSGFEEEAVTSMQQAFKRAKEEGMKETKERYEAILHMMKEQMEKKEESHRLTLQLEKNNSKLSVLDKFEGGGIPDVAAKRQRLEEKIEVAMAELNTVKVPNIDWLKLGIPSMF